VENCGIARQAGNFSIFNFIKYYTVLIHFISKVLIHFISKYKTLHSVGLNGHIFNFSL
jgi:hypothetical protein